VKPIGDHFVGVRLEYYQLQGRKIQGDTAECYLYDPAGGRLAGNRCWKNGRGFTPQELLEVAAKHPSDPARRNALRLSWFLMDPEYYRKDVTDDGAYQRYRSPERPLGEARKARRPLLRVDGPALEALESHPEFLERHVRQFWWTKGDPKAPARLVVVNSNDFPPGAKADEITGKYRDGRVPAVLAVVDLSAGVDLAKVSPVLDESWRKYMAGRPPNNISIHRENPNYSKRYEERFERMEETIRQLAREGRLLAPGGRPLLKTVLNPK
jgi:hypothetical protein